MRKQLIGRNFGDCEIKSISFMNDSVYFRFFDPFETSYFTLIFHAVEHLTFETNHSQNVIETIQLFDDVEDTKSHPAASVFLQKIDASTLNRSNGLKFAYVEPITGGEAFIVFRSFEIEE